MHEKYVFYHYENFKTNRIFFAENVIVCRIYALIYPSFMYYVDISYWNAILYGEYFMKFKRN
jgi:hypothetical protein